MPPVSLFRVVNPPASDGEIAALIRSCGPLPAAYTRFLSLANGAESCVNDREGDCLALWATGEIAGLNEDYAIQRYLPDLLVIGSDGGGDAIGLDRSASADPRSWPVVRIGFGNLDRTDFVQLAPAFRDWLAGGCTLRPSMV